MDTIDTCAIVQMPTRPVEGRLGIIIGRECPVTCRDNSILLAVERGEEGAYREYFQKRIDEGKRLLEKRFQSWKNYFAEVEEYKRRTARHE